MLVRRVGCAAGHFAPDYFDTLNLRRSRQTAVCLFFDRAVRFVVQRIKAGLRDIRVSDQIRLCGEKGPGAGPSRVEVRQAAKRAAVAKLAADECRTLRLARGLKPLQIGL